MSSAPPRFQRRPDLRAVEMDGELVMMGVQQGEYFSLRDVAASLWEHLAEPRTLDELSTLVAAEYAITAGECRDDVAAFLDDLESKQLITIS